LTIQFRSLAEWPAHQPSTPYYRRENARFTASYPDRITLLERELEQISAKDVVLESVLPKSKARRDGWPMSDAKGGPGIIVSFVQAGEPREMLADRYHDWRDNLHAIGKALDALRAVDRWGLTKKAAQYEGFRPALPPPAKVVAITTTSQAAEFVAKQAGVGRTIAPEILNDPETLAYYYRLAAKQLHPDQGGSHELFVQLQTAKELLDKHHKERG